MQVVVETEEEDKLEDEVKQIVVDIKQVDPLEYDPLERLFDVATSISYQC